MMKIKHHAISYVPKDVSQRCQEKRLDTFIDILYDKQGFNERIIFKKKEHYLRTIFRR